MPRRTGDDLTKITLNLFSADVIALRARYGYGYTEQIRRLVHENVVEYRKHKRIIEDYLKEDLDAD